MRQDEDGPPRLWFVVVLALVMAFFLLMVLAALDAEAATPKPPAACPVGSVARPCPPTWGSGCARCEPMGRWVPVRRR